MSMTYLQATLIATGFMNGDLSKTAVVKATESFLGREVTKAEFTAISRAYHKKNSMTLGA